jgi:hypothetical protein
VGLPKSRLAYARRAEDLGDLPAHVSAHDGPAWQPTGSEVSVELQKAGTHGAGASGVERLEGLGGRHSRQSI